MSNTTNPQAQERAAELLSRMTLEEKAQQQLTSVIPSALLGPGGPRGKYLQDNLAQGTSTSACSRWSAICPRSSSRARSTRCNALVEETRLGILAMFQLEAVNVRSSPSVTA